MAVHTVSIEVGGRTMSFETGKLAKLAAASVVGRYEETTLLASVCIADPRPGTDFFPLTVDYRERPSAAGKFPGGFIKREGRPSTKETLTMRMIDRPIRPLFPTDYFNDVLIQALVLSADGRNDPDVLAINASAAAMALSGAPFQGPLAAVRVVRTDGQFIVNPTNAQAEYSDLDVLAAGHAEALNMIEVGAKAVPDEVVWEALALAHEEIKKIVAALAELKEKAGKPLDYTPKPVPAKLKAAIREKAYDRFRQAKLTIKSKQERSDACAQVYRDILKEYTPEMDSVLTGEIVAPLDKLDRAGVKQMISELEEHVTRELIYKDGVRADGRKPDEIRELSGEVSVLPRVHGSAIFTRGETQALVVATLGTAADEQIIDGLSDEYAKKFMLHYNFPPFSTGEVKRITGVSRREIGHGALAERSLEGVLPSPEDFPYTVRLVSDILESNGSSSMATVCGGTLALLDAGVPMQAPVAGISIGMVTPDQDKEDGYVLLTDIIGEEDHYGDMDFKVAGTRDGITGIQLDLKRHGLSLKLVKEVFEKAKTARLFILDKMAEVIPTHRGDISQHAPRLYTTRIDPEKIGKIIGPGGKEIKALQDRTKTRIEIEDDGTVYISGNDPELAQQALSQVEAVGMQVKIGQVFTGKVVGMKDFGVFVELLPGTDGMCHISELAKGRVENVRDVVKMGDMIKVKVILVDENGRIKLSRKAVLQDEAAAGGV